MCKPFLCPGQIDMMSFLASSNDQNAADYSYSEAESLAATPDATMSPPPKKRGRKPKSAGAEKTEKAPRKKRIKKENYEKKREEAFEKIEALFDESDITIEDLLSDPAQYHLDEHFVSEYAREFAGEHGLTDTEIDDFADSYEKKDNRVAPVNRNVVKSYMDTIKDFKVLPKDRERELFLEFHRKRSVAPENYDKSERDLLILHNLKLVAKRANKFHERRINGMEYMDLVSAGNIGLINAVDKFDPTRTYMKKLPDGGQEEVYVKFSTFATQWIDQHIIKAISDTARMIKLPSAVYSASKKLIHFIDDFESKNGVSPTNDDIRAYFKVHYPKIVMTDRKIEDYKRVYADAISYDNSAETGDKDDRATVLATLDDKSISPDDSAVASDFKETMFKVLNKLTKKEREVCLYLFGFEPIPGVKKIAPTLKDVGEYMGLTSERVRQLKVLAFEKIKHPENMSILGEYANYFIGMEDHGGDDSEISI